MSTIKKFVNVASICLILIIMNSCIKENLVSKDSKPSIDNNYSIQKWNPDEGYPFVLINNLPFEYAVYQKDKEELFVYIKFILKEQEVIPAEKSGYFILSFEDAFINYGFLTEATSCYYHLYNPNDPDIPFIDDDPENDGNGDMCFARIRTKDEDRFSRWVERQTERGKRISISYNDGVWSGKTVKRD
jgi:hypothetical protein